MSIKVKSTLFALLFVPALASATDFEHDALTAEIYSLSPEAVVLKSDDMMADINRTIEQEPTAAGALTGHSLPGYPGHNVNNTF